MLSGSKNFRAVKPYPAAGGRRLRAGSLFRSGELSRLSPADLQTVSTLNIRLVCDLRSGVEQVEFPTLWPASPAPVWLETPHRDDPAGDPSQLFELIAAAPGDTGALAAMERYYRHKPAAFAATLRRIFETILQGEALPLLIHCHAGKDRTGFVTAMILTALGVSRADIVDDYTITALFFPAEVESRAVATWAKRSFSGEISPEQALPLAQANAFYIEAAFDEIDARWGNTDAYLTEAVGLASTDREQLRSLLLE